MGGWLDDSGASAALPPVRHIRHRQCAALRSARRALVSALALWALARRQRVLICPLGPGDSPLHLWRARNRPPSNRVDLMLLREETTMRWKISHKLDSKPGARSHDSRT